MKWTYDWLKEYLDTKLSAGQIADELTRIGLEVEDLSSPVAPIAAKIMECKPVEGSDHLHVLKVDDGTKELRQVVCGAPNARVGLVSALAVPGCVIDGHEIQSGKLRGVLSDGMMCSARELGIGDDHSGIIELNPKTKIGSPVLDVKTVFDAGITPNRPDYLSVRGVALDLSAADAGKYIAKEPVELKPVKSSRGVHVKTELCNVYRFAEIHNIKMAKKIEILVERGLRERILTYLNILTSKSGSNSVSVRMNREQLAQFLCVNRSALQREIAKLKKAGVLTISKRKFRLVRNIEG